jgi:hypothetical protein
MNLPMQVQASQEGRRESTGRYKIATQEGRVRALSVQPSAKGDGEHSRRSL